MTTEKGYTQTEAVEYLREKWKIKLTQPQLSMLGVYGAGPEMPLEAGSRRYYTESSLDAWARKHAKGEDQGEDLGEDLGEDQSDVPGEA